MLRQDAQQAHYQFWRYLMDAEGFHEGVVCPQCGGTDTITYRYVEGFEEHECPTCGFREDGPDLADLARYESDLKEARPGLPLPLPRRSIRA